LLAERLHLLAVAGVFSWKFGVVVVENMNIHRYIIVKI
jgi:hypothetical protein